MKVLSDSNYIIRKVGTHQTQCVHRIAADTPEELINNLELVFQQLNKAGLKLSMTKCEFGQKQIEYLAKPFLAPVLLPLKNA